ncbi:hypothetical protein J2795_001031 [Chryseobacterium bernardetii]|uniref:Phage abortive infection protein n=2 Tax=Chryseobacterium TaxID=59732 RepID=A0A543EL81_9FLAO|nr:MULTISPECIES: hypothetical protein [Chryseobacterium]MDR6368731.1 hypothetical protein [Chryseobacterium vietnamense]MDR6440346.1 hypothetical protein [Chryseobacterium bernardetii]TQM22343.1 hypothetical protein FB551_2055 [Chryseobacterium aquifrigidense]
MFENLPLKEILLLILGTLSTYLIWRVQFQKDKIKNIETQLSEKKFQIYSELVYIIFDTMHGEKIGKKVNDKELLKRILDIKKNMFLYASDEMFESFKNWTLELQKPGNNGVDHFKKYFELMKLVRKDMGQSNSKINLDDFMIYIMQNEEEYKKFKTLYNWD